MSNKKDRIVTSLYTTEASESKAKAMSEIDIPDPDDAEAERIVAKYAIGAKQNANTTGDDGRTSSSGN